MKLYLPKIKMFKCRSWLSAIAASALSMSTFADVEPLSVEGNQVLIGGQAGSLAGNSLFWSNNGWGGEKYYTPEVVTKLKTEWNSTLVRAAMGVQEYGAYLTDPEGNKNRVTTVVDAAIANDMYVIIDWHSHHAEDNEAEAISFFTEMAQTYSQYNHVIYEIYNEPLQVSWSGVIKPYAEKVIAAIREHDPDNLIVVGTPNWSQYVDEASLDPLVGDNIAYTLHFYAGTHKQWLRDKADTAMANGIALFVTEWGTVNADGDGGVDHQETQAWMDYLAENNISHANWAVNDKAEGASIYYPGTESLTESGLLVKEIIANWAGIPSGGGEPTPTPTATPTATPSPTPVPTPTATPSPTPTPTPTATPCPVEVVPGKIQAESYCDMSGVQTEVTTDTGGGTNVGWLDAGDWLSYKVNVPASGDYTFTYRVASLSGGGALQLLVGNVSSANVSIPNTGAWQNWVSVTQDVSLEQGENDIVINVPQGGWNLNWFEIREREAVPPNLFEIFIEAEDYDYMSGIQTEPCADAGNGFNVGWIDAGDWMSFENYFIPETGSYVIEYRVASAYSGGVLKFEKAGGAPVYGTVNVPITGSWQSWVTVSHTVELQAGYQSFAIAAQEGGWNVNWFRIKRR